MKMDLSLWISMVAAGAAFIGLIPPFIAMFREGATRKGSADIAFGDAQISEAESKSAPAKALTDSAFGRAILLTGMATAIGVVELVVFGGIAGFMGVDVNIHTMSTLWQLG